MSFADASFYLSSMFGMYVVGWTSSYLIHVTIKMVEKL